jgi:hypothetical protein
MCYASGMADEPKTDVVLVFEDQSSRSLDQLAVTASQSLSGPELDAYLVRLRSMTPNERHEWTLRALGIHDVWCPAKPTD